jgi:tetratricopeptide (TPR) repeat protein
MFFPRMRRHAKWMFVLLAVVFGFGFVLFGVGAGGVGVGELLRGDGGSSGDSPSVSDARDNAAEHPNDAEAQRELANALQLDGQTDEAISTLDRYVNLRPKDADALRELATLYLGQAQQAQVRAQNAQLESSSITGGGIFGPTLTLGSTGTLADQDPITKAVQTRASQIVTDALTESQNATTAALDTYQRLAQADPQDPTAQLELAQTAQNAGQTDTAIAAYEKFLKLAPDDPIAAGVRAQLKQLRQPAPATG